MGMRRPAGYPAGRPVAGWVSDVLVTVAAAALGIPPLFHASPHRPGAAALVAPAIALPLLLRRGWPVQIFAVVLAASASAGLWDIRAVNAAALLVALYTVAVLRPRRDALVCAGLLELTMIAEVIRVAGHNWLVIVVCLSGLVAAPLALGMYAGTRRAYLAELRDRAERLEREQDQRSELAAAAERARIAREMHDIVAHHLTVMVTLSDAAAAASPPGQRATEVMRTVSETGRRALADTRRLVGVLRQGPGEDGDDSGEDLQPVPDLAQLGPLADQVRSAGLPVTLEIHGDTAGVSAGLQLTVYRLVQEALTNTLKHGGPGTRASVRLHIAPGELRVDVEDDGAGAGAEAAVPVPASTGSGLDGMRERVHAYGGQLRAGPREAAGWAVTARLRPDGGEII
jgi:signal transduction histidine kinase